jgi:hypothetical protein
VIMAAAQVPQLLPTTDNPCQVQHFIQHLMGGEPCPHSLACSTHQAICGLYSAPQYLCPDPVTSDMWSALGKVIDFSALRTCLIPAANSPAPAELLAFGLRCFTNSARRSVKAHTRFDPFSLRMHEFYAAGEGVSAYFVHLHPDLLDLMLPLSLMHVGTVVIAAVPVSYMEAGLHHRAAYFLDSIWSKGRGVFVRIIQSSGHQLPMGWLFLFPDKGQHDLLFQGRLHEHSCELLWDSRNPHALTRLSGMHILHSDLVRQQGVQAINRWLQVLARRGGVDISQLPPQLPDPPITAISQQFHQLSK